ncbi:DNA polymerase beta superfamily protein [Kribbella sp. NBC_00889]|uniref:DNA polymerase beta superfamily protein n=1 Tax=Kribbella sp. NBC_00889 TaxID=2975974 RepID=UPI00386EE0A0|nr:nucleotidyltransferase domain-containing protein [Kribbella sp. NBC_00889]
MTRDMRQLDCVELRTIMGEQPYRLLFATVSGAHLYGFPSRDSDVDLRGVHVLPATEVAGLRTGINLMRTGVVQADLRAGTA